MHPPSFDREEILQTLRTFRQTGEVWEMRIPKAGRFKTISGYYQEPVPFADGVIGLSDEGYAGIYFTINPVKPDLLARAANRYVKYAETTTSDADIIALHWLPIDLDAKRPAGISSTDEEHAAAISKAREVRQWLIDEQGWPANAFILADSGNGAHLPAKIDLPNTPESVTLIKHCLAALDARFSVEAVHVDTATYNPARIWKLYGTMARKGDSTPERPHRMAKILEAPDEPATVSREQLEALANWNSPDNMTNWIDEMDKASSSGFDPKQYAEAHGAHVLRVDSWVDPEGGKWELAILEECPFDSSHNRGEARIGVRQDGKRTFRCFHNSCQGKDWQALRDLWEPGRAQQEQPGPTVIDALRLLDGVCDGAKSQDGMGFSKFDREEHSDIIEKAISEGCISTKDEKKAYRFLKKYKKQLKSLGLNYDAIGHISRDEGATDNGLAEINERIPEWIAEHHFKTVTDTERLYHYVDGVYLDDGEIVLKALIEAEFGDLTDNRLVSDIVGKVKRRTYVDRDLFNNRNVVNVRNGLLELDTLQLLPHTPDYLSTAQIDVLYNPEATSPHIQKFLSEVAQSGDVALIEEIIGWLLWPNYSVHKAVMLLGPGRNGKGTLLRLITAFLGKKSISNVTLQDLVADRFAKADLYGKLANIGGDLPSKDLSDTAAFRNLTGGDDNRAQEKYRPAFNFRNKAKMLFSANVLPRSPDDTYAFYSRWILIEFLNVFDLQKGTADPDLDSKLQDPDELSGLLNIALAGLARLRANGWKFSYDKTVEDVEIMYKRNANPVFAFLLDECEPGEATDYIEKTLFYNAFRDYAQAHGIRPLSSTKFSELLKDQTEVPVTTFRPYIEHGDRPWCWQGVRFKDHATLCQSRLSRVLPTPSLRQNESKKREEEKEKEGKVGIRKTLDNLDLLNDSVFENGAAPKSNSSEKGVTTPAEKAQLWASIRSKLKKCGRVDGKRRGIAEHDLQPGEAEVVKAAGWQRETTGTGISILWATEKSIAAMGLEAGT